MRLAHLRVRPGLVLLCVCSFRSACAALNPQESPVAISDQGFPLLAAFLLVLDEKKAAHIQKAAHIHHIAREYRTVIVPQ